MTQRIFDKNNPQDMKDLFDILPDDVEYVYQLAFPDGTIGCYSSNMRANLPIVVKFHGSDKIYRPEPPMEQGTVGFAWDDDDKDWRPLMFYVKNNKDNGQNICKYGNTTGDDTFGAAYDHFVPLKKDDVYFDKNGHMHIKESVAKAL